jgi:phage shock protein C
MSAGLPRRLYRSRQDRMLGGVSAGLAAYFDIDPVLVRLLWVVGAVFTGGLLALAYILLWIIVPAEDYAGPASGVVRENVNEMAAQARRVAEEAREALRAEPGAEPTATEETTALDPSSAERSLPVEADQARQRRTLTGGVILLALGLVFLAANLGVLRWAHLGLYWPVLLVALGALLIWNRSRT